MFSRGEAFAVHFEAFSFFADTACSFFFRSGSGFGMLGLAFLLYDKWEIEWILIIVDLGLGLSDVFLEERQGADWEVFSGLDKLKGLSDSGNGGEAEYTVLRK